MVFIIDIPKRKAVGRLRFSSSVGWRLSAVFPAAMGPEPTGGVAQDGALHAPGVFFGDPVLGFGARGIGE